MLTKNLRAVLLHELVLEDTIRQVYIILPATSQQITSLRNLCILPVSFILVVPILRSHRPGDIVIDAARMLSRVFVTVGCPSVRLSVCPIDRQQQQRLVGLLPSALQAEDSCGRRDAAGAGVQQQTRAASC